MAFNAWSDHLYSDAEFEKLCDESGNFQVYNRNHRARPVGKSFSDFMNAGIAALIAENLDLVAGLI